MRDKVLQFMAMQDFEGMANELVESLIGQFRMGFKEAFGEELPTDAAQALDAVAKALQAKHHELQNAVAEVYETHFTEAELDSLLAFYQGDVGKKLMSVGVALQGAIGDASNIWQTNALKDANPELSRLLGMSPAPTAEASVAAPAP